MEQNPHEGDQRIIVLTKEQKTNICEYYLCSDGNDECYPHCSDYKDLYKHCQLRDFERVLDHLNTP